MAVNTVRTTINGQTYDLTYSSASGKWEASLTAPIGSSFNLPGGYYPVSVTATDTAGNSTTVNPETPTLGDSLKLYVKEKQPPVIVIISPTTGSYIINNTPEIKFTIMDNAIGDNGDSGVAINTLSLVINDGTPITNTSEGMVCTKVDGGYSCTYTPQTAIPDGSCTIKIDASDNDGNAATQATVTFTVDTVAPTLTITSPTDGFETNKSQITVSGITNDATSSPVVITITLNGTDQGSVTVDPDGSFSKNINLVEGSNAIKITATDKAGRTTDVTRTVTLNTSAPQITDVSIVPNPADAGKTYIITVTVVGH